MVLEATNRRSASASLLGTSEEQEQQQHQQGPVAPLLPIANSSEPSSASMRLTASALSHLRLTQAHEPKLHATLVLHTALLQHLPLSSRRLPMCQEDPKSAAFLKDFCVLAEQLLRTNDWSQSVQGSGPGIATVDLVDGRLFRYLASHPSKAEQLTKASGPIASDIQTLWSTCGFETSFEDAMSQQVLNGDIGEANGAEVNGDDDDDDELTLLPFTNKTFDPHLECVRVNVKTQNAHPAISRGIFQELTHWHNTKLLAQPGPKKPATPTEQRAAVRAMRRNQFRMKDMANYAASLTGSNGRQLDPESVFVQSKSAKKEIKAQANGEDAKAKANKQQSTKKPGQKGGAANAIIAANAGKLADAANSKAFSAWKTVMERIEKESPEAHRRYLEAVKYINSLPSDKSTLLETEVLFYRLLQLLKVCAKPPFSATAKPRNFQVAAMVWDHVNKLKSRSLQEVDVRNLEATCKAMGFAECKVKPTEGSQRKPSFKFNVPDAKEVQVEDAKEFQLNHCGPYFDRTIEAAPDARVRFQPDKWQREVLDLIDQRKSAFVVAPTSAGKTFISFYAMKQVLQEDNEGVLVYVAPTKALVNQISAEIQANFNKTYPHAGVSIWALHTRDYRINEPVGCQILVTVPHVLQIMLLSPANANKFSTRVKRIIFDEIHSIGQAEDGLVWEQLLLLAPCPIVALSATVGNPEQFSDWLKVTQKATGNELAMIRHDQRYNDLRKYVYVPPSDFQFSGRSPSTGLGPLGIDGAERFAVIHPVMALVNRSRGMPEDLGLEPQDCLQLWRAMKKVSTEAYPVGKELDPAKCIPSTVRKIDVVNWESKLKSLLRSWMTDPGSPFDAVHKALYAQFTADIEEASEEDEAIPTNKADLIDTILPMLTELDSKGALPVLIFNYERGVCEEIANKLASQLASAEQAYKDKSKAWQKKLAEYDEYVKNQEKNAKVSKKASTKKKGGPAEEGASKADMLADSAQSAGEKGTMGYFNPADPLDEFSFADKKKATPSEIAERIGRLKWANVPEGLVQALERGIGVHHAGMNLAYRQCVEMLFRKGYLKVVIATGTLALGINMPCRTVCFAGDSVFLTALNYRQAAGRAGRRGFDLLGNVVFHGISTDKVFRLISSRLPDLNGHFPVTTSLVLRLCHLLNDSKQSSFAKASINSLLSQPRLYLGGDDFKEQVLHHLRFSIEYLRRQSLLDASGAPIHFAGCIMHLYYTESSSFAFHALLKDGYFHRLATDYNPKSEERILLDLMLVMSHIFGRRPCRRAELEDGYYEKRVHRSPSVVFLPPLPVEASEILDAHNAETKSIFRTYVRTFAEQHLATTSDNTLPLTHLRAGGSGTAFDPALFPSLPPNKIRSAFTSLSGHSDDFATIHELCRTARAGVFLEEAVIPHLPTDAAAELLNAYLYDFYKHGDVHALEAANGIRADDVWFLLNDFSLVVATIVTALKNYMNLAASDMLEVRGRGEAQEDELDDGLVEEMLAAQARASAADAAKDAAPAKRTAKKKIADSWDEAADAEEEDDAEAEAAAEGLQRLTVGGDAFDMTEGGGLLKVLRAFEGLKRTFDEKFRATWA